MKKIIVWVLSVMLFLIPHGEVHSKTNYGNICSVYENKRHWYWSVRRAERDFSVSIPYLTAVVLQESSFQKRVRPTKRNRVLSSSKGFSQATKGTWEEYKQDTKMGNQKRTSFRDSVYFIGWYFNKVADQRGVSKSDFTRHYLAYHNGYNSDLDSPNSSSKKSVVLFLQKLRKYQEQYKKCARSLRNHRVIDDSIKDINYRRKR